MSNVLKPVFFPKFWGFVLLVGGGKGELGRQGNIAIVSPCWPEAKVQITGVF